MDEFQEIQVSLCPPRKGANDGHDNCRRGNYANDDCRSYGPPDNRRPYGPPENDRYYGPRRDCDDNYAFTNPCIPVFSQAFDGRQPPTVPIDAELPHFVMKIGNSGIKPTPILTPCAGYASYSNGILSMHPECVDKKIVSTMANIYSPI